MFSVVPVLNGILLFRHTKNAAEFIAVWNQNTAFNKVTQSTESIPHEAAEGEQEDSSEQLQDIDGVSERASKRPAKDSLNQGAAQRRIRVHLMNALKPRE